MYTHRHTQRDTDRSDCVDVWYVTGWGRGDKDPLKQTPMLMAGVVGRSGETSSSRTEAVPSR